MDKGARKVGIICHSMGDNNYCEYEVKLYVINVDSEAVVETYTHVVPAVRFSFPKRESILAVCVVNSTVYMFGGPEHRSFTDQMFRDKYAVKFVLTDEVLAKGDYKVYHYDHLTEKISVMNHDKNQPVAIPTPDGNKILLFGTRIGVGRSCRARDPYGWYDDDDNVLDTWEESCLAFELYDTLLDTWEQLPGLPCRDVGGFCVRCYSFVDESHFFVVTDKGNFVLDFKDKLWAAAAAVGTPEVYDKSSGYFVTAKGRYVLTSAGMVYDLGGSLLGTAIGKDFNSGPSFPLSSFAPPNAPASLQKVAIPSIVPLRPVVQEEDGEVCNTCVLRLETRRAVRETRWSESRGAARVLIDVCRTELTTLNTTVSNCVSLHIDCLEFLKGLTLISV